MMVIHLYCCAPQSEADWYFSSSPWTSLILSRKVKMKQPPAQSSTASNCISNGVKIKRKSGPVLNGYERRFPASANSWPFVQFPLAVSISSYYQNRLLIPHIINIHVATNIVIARIGYITWLGFQHSFVVYYYSSGDIRSSLNQSYNLTACQGDLNRKSKWHTSYSSLTAALINFMHLFPTASNLGLHKDSVACVRT